MFNLTLTYHVNYLRNRNWKLSSFNLFKRNTNFMAWRIVKNFEAYYLMKIKLFLLLIIWQLIMLILLSGYKKQLQTMNHFIVKIWNRKCMEFYKSNLCLNTAILYWLQFLYLFVVRRAWIFTKPSGMERKPLFFNSIQIFQQNVTLKNLTKRSIKFHSRLKINFY